VVFPGLRLALTALAPSACPDLSDGAGMNYLLHCIVEQGWKSRRAERELPCGRLWSGGGGLADESDEPPTVAGCWPSSGVESIHARQTVLPLRYGCRMESEAEILRLLEERREEYEALIERLRA